MKRIKKSFLGKRIRGTGRLIHWMMTSYVVLFLMACTSVWTTAATGADVVSQGFSGLLDIVTALISSIGTIILLWGFFEWGLSLQGQDGFTQSTAFKRIGGGLVMILAPQLLNIFLIQP